MLGLLTRFWEACFISLLRPKKQIKGLFTSIFESQKTLSSGRDCTSRKVGSLIEAMLPAWLSFLMKEACMDASFRMLQNQKFGIKVCGTIVCASIQHVLYLPEVCCQASGSGCAQYLTEQVVTGLDIYALRHLHFASWSFTFCSLADLWNTFVVPCPPGDATPQLCSGLSKRNVAAARLSFPAALVSVRQAASIHLPQCSS